MLLIVTSSGFPSFASRGYFHLDNTRRMKWKRSTKHETRLDEHKHIIFSNHLNDEYFPWLRTISRRTTQTLIFYASNYDLFPGDHVSCYTDGLNCTTGRSKAVNYINRNIPWALRRKMKGVYIIDLFSCYDIFPVQSTTLGVILGARVPAVYS